MSKRKVYEQVNVNEITGEIKYHHSHYSDKYTESFIMIRTTNGKDWFYALSNNEKNLLMAMWDWCSHEDMSVYLGSIRRSYVVSDIGISKRQITAVLASLCAKNYIKRIGRDDFLINPAYMFKCSVGKVREKMIKYEEYVVEH